MKTLLIILILITGSTNLLKSQEYETKDLKKIHSFLLKLKGAAVEKDTNSLHKLIQSIQVRDDINSGKEIIDKIILNDEESYGDFSFSVKAFNQIVDSLYTKFVPIPDDLFEKIRRDEYFMKLTQGLENEEIPIFDYKNVHIVLIKRKRKFKLIFWENMNKLIGDFDENTKSEPGKY